MVAGIVTKLPSLLMLATLISLAAGIQAYTIAHMLILAALCVFSAAILIIHYAGAPRGFPAGLLPLFFFAALVFSYFLPRPIFTLPLFVSGLGLVLSAYSFTYSAEAGAHSREIQEEPETEHKVIIEHLPELSPGEIDEKLHLFVASPKGKTYHVPDCPMIAKMKKKNLIHLDHYHAKKLKLEPCACVKIYTFH